MNEISVREVQARLDAGAALVDVREDDEFAAGHAPGAIHVALSRLAADALPHASELLMVCRSGRRSQKAVDRAAGAGLAAVNVTGGMLAWCEAGLPLCAEGPASAEVV